MKETILITGAGPNSVTGQLIKKRLQDDYLILSPSSKELDLTDDDKVRRFFEDHDIDFVIHCALYRAKANESITRDGDDLEKNLRMFYALASQAHRVKKMIYFGSGSEYNKAKDIINATEDKDYGNSIPFNIYGFSKYIMNLYARKSENIYNFRLFGTINPFEPYTKNVLSNICMKAIKCDAINLIQDCKFSWIDIDDVVTFIRYAFTHELKYHDYNLANNQQCTIGEMAAMINEINHTHKNILFQKEGFNLEYTACNDRWVSECNLPQTPIKESLMKVYKRMAELAPTVDLSAIDSRWNLSTVHDNKPDNIK
jgi:GDP-L-fucose synthase